MDKIKLIDVAAAAGVSPATVSRIVRHNGYVSEEKRIAVEKAMAALGYTAPVPQDDPYGAPPQVLLISPGRTSPLFETISIRIGEALQRMGWQLVIHYSFETRAEQLIPVINKALKGNLRGVVFNCCGNAFDFMPIRSYLISLPAPAVMLERSPDIYGLNKVMLNAEEMLFTAVEYLARRGHDRIIYIGRDCDYETERKRLSGFNSGLAAMGLSEGCTFVPVANYMHDDGYSAIAKYIAENGLPSAIIAPDPLLMGVLAYLYEQKLRVPDDVSIVGLDDTFAALASPPLTSVAFPVSEIAQSTVQILTDAASGFTSPRSVLLSTHLTERASVAIKKK